MYVSNFENYFTSTFFDKFSSIFLFFLQDLKDYFRSAGEITYTNAHTPRQGEGIVEFAARRGLEYALDHRDELELDGRKL